MHIHTDEQESILINTAIANPCKVKYIEQKTHIYFVNMSVCVFVFEVRYPWLPVVDILVTIRVVVPIFSQHNHPC